MWRTTASLTTTKLDEETDGEVVVGPTAQGYKQQFSHAKAKPEAESSNRTASGAVNRSGSVCPLEKRAGKTKSGVSTPVKTKAPAEAPAECRHQ